MHTTRAGPPVRLRRAGGSDPRHRRSHHHRQHLHPPPQVPSPGFNCWSFYFQPQKRLKKKLTVTSSRHVPAGPGREAEPCWWNRARNFLHPGPARAVLVWHNSGTRARDTSGSRHAELAAPAKLHRSTLGPDPVPLARLLLSRGRHLHPELSPGWAGETPALFTRDRLGQLGLEEPPGWTGQIPQGAHAWGAVLSTPVLRPEEPPS